MHIRALGLALGLAFAMSAHAAPLRFGVISDVNGSACQTQYPASSLIAFDQLLSNHELDHIIMPGDAVGGGCTSTVPNYEDVVQGMWEEFDRRFVHPARSLEGVNLVLAPGNHDAPYLFPNSRPAFHQENEGFLNYWLGRKAELRMESVEVSTVKSNYPYYWAYKFENVLFIVLQSTRTHTLSYAESQKKWLKAVLASRAATTARARIAFGHVPPYPVLDPSVGFKFGEIIEKEQVGEVGGLMDMLLQANVDLLVVGHSHAPYPADLTRVSDGKKIKILSMPCTHGPRALRTKTELAPRGYAVVELDEANRLKVSIRNWSDGRAIPASYFPPEIPLGDSRVRYRRMRALVE